MLNQFRKYSLFADLKKYYFHQDKVHFLEYIICSKEICIEDKKIEVIKNWPKLKVVQDI